MDADAQGGGVCSGFLLGPGPVEVKRARIVCGRRGRTTFLNRFVEFDFASPSGVVCRELVSLIDLGSLRDIMDDLNELGLTCYPTKT
jgi:hypothetical protein